MSAKIAARGISAKIAARGMSAKMAVNGNQTHDRTNQIVLWIETILERRTA